LYHIAELYGCTGVPNEGLKWSPDKLFAEIARMEREHPLLAGKHIYGIADPSIWDASRGMSIAEMAEAAGVYFDPGDNKRIPGWAQVHYRLRFDDNGIPMLYVFRTCRNWIRTMPLLTYDAHKPEDLDTKQEDHIADMTRYVCMARPISPAPAAPKQERPGFDPLGLYQETPEYDKYGFYTQTRYF
jgi:hypothetical protein